MCRSTLYIGCCICASHIPGNAHDARKARGKDPDATAGATADDILDRLALDAKSWDAYCKFVFSLCPWEEEDTPEYR